MDEWKDNEIWLYVEDPGDLKPKFYRMKDDDENKLTQVFKSKLSNNGLDVRVPVEDARKMVRTGLPLENGEVSKMDEGKKVLIIVHERNFGKRRDFEKKEYSQKSGGYRNNDRSERGERGSRRNFRGNDRGGRRRN